jgi:two-component system, OmpR family, alkaline phosphatase synthesis response regulator PhoP
MVKMQTASASRVGRRKTILVVDDDMDLNEVMCNFLSDAGYETYSAYDGKEGMTMTREVKPDLVLLDIMLPNVDGIEVCRNLTKDENTKSIPIIMVTVKGELSSKLSSYIAGARRYITKPVEMDDLITEVGKVLK